MDNRTNRQHLADELQADNSQLDNVFTSSMITGNYDLISSEELDEVTFLEDKIESLQSELDELDDDDKFIKTFYTL